VNSYSLSHLSDPVLLRDLAALVTRDRATTAALLAHIAEVDDRRLYLPATHPSMFSYCVHELRLCEQAAFKRIRAARTARQFPAIFTAVASGRLHLSAVVLLTPYLTPENAYDLLAAAAHQTKAGIEQLLAERFPRPDLSDRVDAISPPQPIAQLSPGTVETNEPGEPQLAPGQVDPRTPGRHETTTSFPKVAPLAPERYALQLTVGQATHDKLRHAQALLGHQVPSGDLAQVLDRALDALIGELEKRKFAATPRPRQPRRPTINRRHIPAHVKRAVWERDGGRCTFVSETGHRCPARTRLEFDHIDEVARGGQASVGRIRLRCRAHNQYAAERTFGTEFMRIRREQARQRAAAARLKGEAEVDARRKAADEAQRRAQARMAAEEVLPALRALGFSAGESRRAAALCEAIPRASLEDRVKKALSYLCPKSRPHGLVPSDSPPAYGTRSPILNGTTGVSLPATK